MAKKHKKLPVEKIFIVVAVIIIVLVLYLSQKANEPKNVVSVNGKIITTADLDSLLLSVPEQQRQSLTRENLTEIAINKALIMDEVSKRSITVSEEEVDAVIGNFLAQNNITLAEYTSVLEQQGGSIGPERNAIKEALLVNKLINETIMKSITVSDEETSQFYSMYKDQINNTYENSKADLEEIIKVQKAQQSFLAFIQQLRENAEIKYY